MASTMTTSSPYARYLQPQAVASNNMNTIMVEDLTDNTSVTDVTASYNNDDDDSQKPLLNNSERTSSEDDSDSFPQQPGPHRYLQKRPPLKKNNSHGSLMDRSLNRRKRSKSRERRRVPRSRSNQELLDKAADANGKEFHHSERSGHRPGLFRSFSFADRRQQHASSNRDKGDNAEHLRPQGPPKLPKRDKTPEPPVRRGVRRHRSCRGNLMSVDTSADPPRNDTNSSSDRRTRQSNKDSDIATPRRGVRGSSSFSERSRRRSDDSVATAPSSSSFSERHGRRPCNDSDATTQSRRSAASAPERQRRRRANDSSEEDNNFGKRGTPQSLPRRGVRRHHSCKDLGTAADSNAATDASPPPEPLNDAFLSQVENKSSVADELEHFKATAQLYKDEFKRLVQEKKQLLSSFVSETAELTEEVAVLRRMLAQSQEENKKLRSSLNDVGVQPSSLAALTESDGLVKDVFEHTTDDHSRVDDKDDNKSEFTAGLSTTNSKPDHSAPFKNLCEVVKGPGLLRTEVHRPKPTIFALPGLRSLPFWTQQTSGNVQTEVAYQDASLTWAVRHFEKHFNAILSEYNRMALNVPSDYNSKGEVPEHDMQLGTCEMRSYLKRGKIQNHFTDKFVRTSAILQAVRDKGLLLEDAPFGAVYFSTLKRQSLVATHSSPMNLRIRLHLPLIVPEDSGVSQDEDQFSCSSLGCGLRVGPLRRSYEAGKVLLMDDSYEHESWNESDKDRVILVVDLWHPDVTSQERKTIVAHSVSPGRQATNDWSSVVS